MGGAPYRVINEASAISSCPADTVAPEKGRLAIDITNKTINVAELDSVVVELCISGSAGTVAAKVKPYSYQANHWAARGTSSGLLEISAAFNDDACDRKLLFRVDTRDADALALAIDTITGTDAKLTVNVYPAGEGF